jgi:surface antigen-like variable number repeat protein
MRIAAFALACLFLPLSARAECPPKQDHRSNQSGGIQVRDVVIHGILKVSSREIAGITSAFTGACFNDDSEELGEWVRAEFQNLGYMNVEMKNLRIKAVDAVANPKLVDLDAEVVEGPRYRISEIEFTGNHAFPSTRLRQKFPIKRGDIFARAKIASGLDALRQIYASHGYIDVTFTPDTVSDSNAKMRLILSFQEGKQYRMGTLYIQAKKELADQLRLNWQLSEGRVFDHHYLGKFVEANHALLPKEFTEADSIRVLRDCDNATIQIVLQVDFNQPAPDVKSSGCESESSKTPSATTN